MNVEIGTEAAKFSEKEYINGILVAVQQMRVLCLFDYRDNHTVRPPTGLFISKETPSAERR